MELLCKVKTFCEIYPPLPNIFCFFPSNHGNLSNIRNLITIPRHQPAPI